MTSEAITAPAPSRWKIPRIPMAVKIVVILAAGSGLAAILWSHHLKTLDDAAFEKAAAAEELVLDGAKREELARACGRIGKAPDEKAEGRRRCLGDAGASIEAPAIEEADRKALAPIYWKVFQNRLEHQKRIGALPEMVAKAPAAPAKTP